MAFFCSASSTRKSFILGGWSDHGLEMMKPLSFDYCECHVMPFLQQLVLTLIVCICCVYKFYIDYVFLAEVVKHCWGQNLFIRLVFCTSLQACFGWKHYWQMLSQLFVFKQSKNFTVSIRDMSYSRYVIAFFSRCPVGEGTTEYTKLRFPEQWWRVH